MTGRQRFWPGPPWAAFIASLMLFVALVGLLAFTRNTMQWPSNADVGALVLPIVVVALIPLVLLVIEGLSDRGGTIDVVGVSLSFASTSQTVAATVQTTTLSQNLGTAEDAEVGSSSLTSILDALRAAHRSDVTVIDLGQGQAWWESRLFILVAGAAQRESPKAIAFVGDRGGAKRRFLGWAEPTRLLDVHLQANSRLSAAYRRARAEVAQWQVGIPAGLGPSGQPAVITPWGGHQYLPLLADGRADPSFAFELYLQASLDDPDHVELRKTVSAQGLLELYESELITDALDVDAGIDQWSRMLTSRNHRFFALTESGDFKGLVPRDGLVAALVAQLLDMADAVTPGGKSASHPSPSRA